MKHFYLLLTFVASFHFVSGQIDFTPYPGNNTHCPGELLKYTASGTNCGVFTWTITNGKILNPADNSEVTTLTAPSVDIRWDDVAGTGKLKVSSTCGGEVKSEEKSFAIRSLNGRTPQNLRYNQLQPYCSTLGINLAVDIMWLENTGIGTGVDQQRADGYEWSLPTGWKYNGTGGTIRTPQEFIFIEPDNGCVGGTVTVKAYMNCSSGRKYSSSASISINRIGFSSNLGVPSGYTGPKCGNTSPVTFTAANLSCAQTYRWTATNTNWRDGNGALGPWTTATNTLTLYPSGDPSDQGVIAVDINIGCATLTQTYNAVYTNPPLSNPVFTSNSAQLVCSNSSGAVSVNAVSGAANYSWYTTGGTVYVNGVITSSNNPVVTTSPNVTVSSPSISGAGYKVYLNVKANRQNLNCAGSSVRTREIWLGRPVNVQAIALGLDDTSPFYVCPNTTYQFNAFDFTNITNVTTFNWYTYNNHTIVNYNGTGNITANIKTGNTVHGTYISVRAQNNCGNAPSWTDALLYQQGAGCSGGGGCLECSFSMSPNPTSDYVELSFDQEEPLTEDFQVGLYDSQGTLISQNHSTAKNTRIDTKNLKNGVYIIKIVSEKETFERRLYINK